MTKLSPHSGIIEDKIHKLPLRVYYEDTDAGRIVYYANYLKYIERGRSDYLRMMNIDQIKLMDPTFTETPIQFVVKSCTLNYHRAAYLDDEIIVETKITKAGRASLIMQQNIIKDTKLLVDATVKVGVIGIDHRPCPLAAPLYEILKQHCSS